MEEISVGQFRMPIERYDGARVSMEIKQKRMHSKKRRVKTWTQEEDAILLDLYAQYPKKWGVIAGLMQDRNENQCLHRYRRITQLGEHRKIWSTEEDETVRKLIRKVGRNWKVLSEMLGSKTGKQIRERFINKLDPKINRDDWTDEEDRRIITLYSEIGRRWSEISKHLPGRPENKVKNRFYSFIQKNYDIKYRPLHEHQGKEDEKGREQQKNSEE
jgi:myb proto-oncogene protein